MSAPTSLLAAALDYAARGFPVFPLHDPVSGRCSCGSLDCKSPAKHPRTERGFKEATTDPGVIRGWWTRWPTANIGIWTEHLLLLDVDDRHGGRESLEKLTAKHGTLPEGPEVRTGSGGSHYYLKPPAGVEIGCSASRLGPGLDVRARGGYVVAPPSLHASGEHYEWVVHPDEVEIPEAPAWLIERLQKPSEEQNGAQQDAQSVPALPPTEHRRAMSALASIPPEAREIWMRAGMAVKTALGEAGFGLWDAWSRTTSRGNYDGSTQRAQWNSFAPGERSDQVSESSLWYLARQYGWEEPGTAGGNEKNKAQPWGELVSIETPQLPEFPVEALGGKLAQFVKAVATAFQVPVAMPAMLALAVLAAVVAKRLAIRIKEGWSEALTLYVAAIMLPGERKTGTFGAIIAPVEAWEIEQADALAAEITIKTRERQDAQARVDALSKKAATAKADTRPGLLQDLKEARTELDEIKVPDVPRALFDDATPESVGQMLARLGGRLAALVSEGGLFETLAGRYNNDVPNLDLFLKGWDGKEAWRRDRVGESVRVRSPILTLGLAVQPDVLRGLASKRGFRGRGMIARFLFVLPDSRMGSREVDPLPIPKDLRDWWSATIRGLLDRPDERDKSGEIETHELSLQRKATLELFRIARALEPRLGPDGDLRSMTDWAGKLVGHIARVGGLLHLADQPGNAEKPVPPGPILRAEIVGACLTEHFKGALSEMGADPAIELARSLLRWIVRRQAFVFSERDALDGLPREQRRSKHVREALDVLEERGYVRPCPSAATGRAGRPASPIWETNPAALGERGSADIADTFRRPGITQGTGPEPSSEAGQGVLRSPAGEDESPDDDFQDLGKPSAISAETPTVARGEASGQVGGDDAPEPDTAIDAPEDGGRARTRPSAVRTPPGDLPSTGEILVDGQAAAGAGGEEQEIEPPRRPIDERMPWADEEDAA